MPKEIKNTFEIFLEPGEGQGFDDTPRGGKTRGPFIPEDADEILYRRRRSTSPPTSIRVRLFDLGYNSGSFDVGYTYVPSLLFTVKKTFSFVPNQTPPPPPSVVYPKDEYNYFYLGVSKGGAYEIRDLQRHGLMFNGYTGSITVGQGIELPAESSLVVSSLTTFHFFSTTGGAKITTSSTYGAAEVPFVFDADTEMYLTPRMTELRGRSRRSGAADPVNTITPVRDQFLNCFYTILPRSYLLNHPAIEAHLGRPPLWDRFQLGLSSSPFYVPLEAYQKAWRDYHLALPDARLFTGLTRFGWTGSSNDYLMDQTAWISPSEWFGWDQYATAPTDPYLGGKVGSPVGPLIPGRFVTSDNTPRIMYMQPPIEEGLLMAILVKGGQTYYVWSNSFVDYSLPPVIASVMS